jgi:hypothetical protein
MRCTISKSLQIIAASVALLLLQACGPGTGGTSPGPILNSQPLPGTQPSASTQAPTGLTAPLNPALWGDASGKIVVTLVAGNISVNANCIVYEFVGPWASVDDLTQLKNSSGHRLKISIIDSMSMEIIVTDSNGQMVFAANSLRLLPDSDRPISCPFAAG